MDRVTQTSRRRRRRARYSRHKQQQQARERERQGSAWRSARRCEAGVDGRGGGHASAHLGQKTRQCVFGRDGCDVVVVMW